MSSSLLKVSNGPTYQITVSGTGVPPGLHFSFNSYNFGASFIYRAGMPAPTATLMLTNRDRKEIRYDYLTSSFCSEFIQFFPCDHRYIAFLKEDPWTCH